MLKDNYASIALFDSMKKEIEHYLLKPGLRDALENHKSNWIPNSKGGEPNHKE